MILPGKKKERKDYDHSHNLRFLQRKQEKVKITILDKEDAEKLIETVDNRGTYSPYNDVRNRVQNTTEESVKRAIEIAEKACDNVRELKEKQSVETMKFDGFSVTFPRTG